MASGHSIQMQKNMEHSQVHGTFSRIDHIMGNKSSLSKFNKTEIIPSLFCEHNAMRLDNQLQKKTAKNTNS